MSPALLSLSPVCINIICYFASFGTLSEVLICQRNVHFVFMLNMVQEDKKENTWTDNSHYFTNFAIFGNNLNSIFCLVCRTQLFV